jgi:predicted ArsR family transcriptional regulator
VGLESLSVLGRNGAREVLRYLLENGSGTPSGIAKALGMHIVTVTRYLEALHDIGVLSREKKMGRTREVYVYSVAARRVSIEIDVEEYVYGEARREEEASEFYRRLLEEMVRRAAMAFGDDGVYSSVPVPERPTAEDVRNAVRIFREKYGPTIARSIFLTSVSVAGEGVEDARTLLEGWERWFQ